MRPSGYAAALAALFVSLIGSAMALANCNFCTDLTGCVCGEISCRCDPPCYVSCVASGGSEAGNVPTMPVTGSETGGAVPSGGSEAGNVPTTPVTVTKAGGPKPVGAPDGQDAGTGTGTNTSGSDGQNGQAGCFNDALCKLAEAQLGRVRRLYVGQRRVECIEQYCYTSSHVVRYAGGNSSRLASRVEPVYACNWDSKPGQPVVAYGLEIHQQTNELLVGLVKWKFTGDWIHRALTSQKLLRWRLGLRQSIVASGGAAKEQKTEEHMLNDEAWSHSVTSSDGVAQSREERPKYSRLRMGFAPIALLDAWTSA
jgi:hypothetical protein